MGKEEKVWRQVECQFKPANSITKSDLNGSSGKHIQVGTNVRSDHDYFRNPPHKVRRLDYNGVEQDGMSRKLGKEFLHPNIIKQYEADSVKGMKKLSVDKRFLKGKKNIRIGKADFSEPPVFKEVIASLNTPDLVRSRNILEGVIKERLA